MPELFCTVVGWPFWEEVAKIANVILATDEVTGNRVRKLVEKRGDLYAKVKVVLPSHLSDEQERLFEELRTTGA